MTYPATNSASNSPRLRVLIVGAGLSGLCIANSLLRDPAQRFDVSVFERDTVAFDSERGGYQIRLGQDGITGLKTCLSPETYLELSQAWGGELSRAPAIFQPTDGTILAKLAELKLYPQSRAVPRTALKEYLVRLPMEKGALHFGRRVDSLVYQDNGDVSEVVLKFEDGSKVTGDIIIAADGSRSKLNRLAGLNNVKLLAGTAVCQGRGKIDAPTRAKLPKILLDNGSMLYLSGETTGFCAVYELKDARGNPTEDSFLFWGHNGPEKIADLFAGKDDDDAKAGRMAEHMVRDLGFDPHILPEVVRIGNRNLKAGQLSSSTTPHDWRGGVPQRGRLIFIGDSIHAMTPSRGQGANQAMRDAAELSYLLLGDSIDVISPRTRLADKDALVLAKKFDEEMYPRAFGWVKASETAGNVDTTTWSGYLKMSLFLNAVRLGGLAVTLRDSLGLGTSKTLTF